MTEKEQVRHEYKPLHVRVKKYTDLMLEVLESDSALMEKAKAITDSKELCHFLVEVAKTHELSGKPYSIQAIRERLGKE